MISVNFPLAPSRSFRLWSGVYKCAVIAAMFAVGLKTGAAQDVARQIAQVENGLSPKVHIQGAPVQKWTIAERLEHYHVPGVSVAVVVDNKVAWAKGFGMATPDRAVATDTLFQAASISKTVSAITALRLVELDKLSLDEDVNDKLTSWKLPASDAMHGEHVTLRRLLSHTAGLTVHGFAGYAQGAPVPTLVQLLDGAKPANSDPVRVDIKPGTTWRYSGGGYEVMQQLIQDVTGKPYAQVVRELVLEPLGMNHSTYEQPLPEPLRASAATAYNGKGQAIRGKWNTYPEQAAAGLWTTPSDLSKAIIEIQKPGRVLNEKSVQLMLTPVLDHYGLGLQLSDTDGRSAFLHGGANAGFRCMLFGYVQGGQGAVVMTNGDNGAALANEILSSIGAAYGWADFRPVEKSVIALAAEKIARYAGTYEAPHNFRIVITVENGKLYIQPPGFPKLALLPQAEDMFFDPDGQVPDLHFSHAQDGTLQLSGGGLTAKRVNHE